MRKSDLILAPVVIRYEYTSLEYPQDDFTAAEMNEYLSQLQLGNTARAEVFFTPTPHVDAKTIFYNMWTNLFQIPDSTSKKLEMIDNANVLEKAGMEQSLAELEQSVANTEVFEKSVAHLENLPF